MFIRRLFLPMGLTAAMLGLSGCGDSTVEPTASPAEHVRALAAKRADAPAPKIVYSSNVLGTQDLWVMDGDGSNPTSLFANYLTEETSPRWSPFRDRIAFKKSSYDANTNLFNSVICVIWLEPFHSECSPLPTTGYIADLAWNPFGDAVFYSVDGKLRAVLLSNGAIDQDRPIYQNSPPYEQIPAWNLDLGPDAQLVTEYYGVIRTWSKDFTTPTVVMTGVSVVNGIRWSPDGRRLLYSANDANADAKIFSMKPDGTVRKQLTTGASIKDSWPSWSPDGKYIVFHRQVLGSPGLNIIRMRADGSEQTVLTTGYGVPYYHEMADWGR